MDKNILPQVLPVWPGMKLDRDHLVRVTCVRRPCTVSVSASTGQEQLMSQWSQWTSDTKQGWTCANPVSPDTSLQNCNKLTSIYKSKAKKIYNNFDLIICDLFSEEMSEFRVNQIW